MQDGKELNQTSGFQRADASVIRSYTFACVSSRGTQTAGTFSASTLGGGGETVHTYRTDPDYDCKNTHLFELTLF